MLPKRRKQSDVDNDTYVPRPPQTRAKKQYAVQSSPPKPRLPSLPHDPRALFVQAQSNLSIAISERRKVGTCLQDTLQRRANLIRARDWAQATNGLDTEKANGAQAKVLVVDDEVASAKGRYAEMWAAEKDVGKVLNELWAEVKALDEAKVFRGRGGRVEWRTGGGATGSDCRS